MGSEDEAQLAPREQPAQIVGADVLVGQAPRRVAHRARPRRRRLTPLAVGDPAHALVVLREVHELKPAGQRAHEHLGLAEVQLSHHLGELVRSGSVALPRAPGERDRALVQLERRLAIAMANHLREHVGEEPLVVGELAQS